MGHPDGFLPERLCLPVCSIVLSVRCLILIHCTGVDGGAPGHGRAVTGSCVICVDGLADV